jgi:hypothetical protein
VNSGARLPASSQLPFNGSADGAANARLIRGTELESFNSKNEIDLVSHSDYLLSDFLKATVVSVCLVQTLNGHRPMQ